LIKNLQPFGKKSQKIAGFFLTHTVYINGFSAPLLQLL